MATFGKTVTGGTSSAITHNFQQCTGPFTLSQDGTVTGMSMYMSHSGAAQVIKSCIWADNSGIPGALKLTSNELSVSGTQAAQWFDFTLPSNVPLTAGSYWLGFIAGDADNTLLFYYDSVANSRKFKSQSYASGPSNPFGAVSSDGFQFSIYATYATEQGPSNTVAPVASGNAAEGQTLSCTTGTWSGDTPITYAYQWQSDSSGDGNFSNISGATSSGYILTASEVGDKVRCNVTATNSAGNATAASNALGPVSESGGSSSQTNLVASLARRPHRGFARVSRSGR